MAAKNRRHWRTIPVCVAWGYTASMVMAVECAVSEHHHHHVQWHRRNEVKLKVSLYVFNDRGVKLVVEVVKA